MKISTLWLGFGLCGVTVGAIVWAQTGHTPPLGAPTTGVSKSTSVTGTPTVNTSMSKPLPFYGSNQISERLFARPLPPAPTIASPTETVKPPPPSVQPLPPPDPLADYVYSGTVIMGDKRMALLENTKTKDGQFVKVGDTFHGGLVTQIEAGQVSLRLGDAMRMMPKSLAINLTPLDRNAAFLGGGQTGPGGPGGRPGGPGNAMQGNAEAQAAMMQAAMMQAQSEAMRAAMEQAMPSQMKMGDGIVTDLMITDR